MTNKNTLDQAREWSEHAKTIDEISVWPTALAAAEVIQSLPDEWVDAAKVRDILANHHPSNGGIVNMRMWESLQALLPAPAPRTMAEIEWDDEEHPYMEAVTVSGRRLILLAPMGNTAVSENTILVAEPDGGVPVLVPAEGLSPTGRYARLSLPDDVKQVMEESVEDYKAGRFVDFDTPEPASPRPEDVPVGEPWQVEVDGETAIGVRNDPEDLWPWCVTYQAHSRTGWRGDNDVKLIARLVPETTEQVFAPSRSHCMPPTPESKRSTMTTNRDRTTEIIRTVEELEALDPDTALTLYTWDGGSIWQASYLQKYFEDDGYIPDLPAVVIATGAQVRAAREALEKEETNE